MRAASFLYKPLNEDNHQDVVDNFVWPCGEEAYELLEDCGKGISGVVSRAVLRSNGAFVAIKRLGIQYLEDSLQSIITECLTMKSYSHPNILRLHCAFVAQSLQELWMVMPYMVGGSVAHIMRFKFAGGLESEALIATILKDVLQALVYIHSHHGIHRDVKAGNMLVHSDGGILLGDYGTAASLDADGLWGRGFNRRRTFIGTPQWMAPEVVQPEQAAGYGSPADIWSFGITVLELANGHAPFSQCAPFKVLMSVLQGEPPQLEQTCPGKPKWSNNMRNMVGLCLQKDPSERPTAATLLKHPFFHQAKGKSLVVKHLLDGLPSLTERVHMIKSGLGAPRLSELQQDAKQSQANYLSQLSSWDFNIPLPEPENISLTRPSSCIDLTDKNSVMGRSISASTGLSVLAGSGSSGHLFSPTSMLSPVTPDLIHGFFDTPGRKESVVDDVRISREKPRPNTLRSSNERMSTDILQAPQEKLNGKDAPQHSSFCMAPEETKSDTPPGLQESISTDAPQEVRATACVVDAVEASEEKRDTNTHKVNTHKVSQEDSTDNPQVSPPKACTDPSQLGTDI